MEEELQPILSKIRQTSNPSGTRFLPQAALSQEADLSPPTTDTHTTHRTHKKRRVKRKKKADDFISLASFDIPGVSKITISPIAQKTIGCTVGEQVTAENPWKHVSKEIFEDNLEIHEGSSEFLPIKNDLLIYPRPEILLGYIPDETKDWDEFYICLTESAEDIVTEIISRIRELREERLCNTIYKTVKPWLTMGSKEEVDCMQVKQNRPLLEVEVESQYPILATKCKFKLRLAQDARDGYAEILPGRRIYSNVNRKRIDAAVQVRPPMTSNSAQTFYTFPKNASTQYEYEFIPKEKVSEELIQNMEMFAKREMDNLSDMINVNTNINFYINDYHDLVRDVRFTRAPEVSNIKETASFIDENICKGKQISSVSFHPMWTGVFAIAYTLEAPSTYRKEKPNTDDVSDAIYNVAPVLLWSFKDNLQPRLHLETSHEVSVVSFCPFDENIVVGGCSNGQVIIWDIKNKLQNVEEEEILTTAQQGYRKLIYSLMGWMKNTHDLRLVRLAAISNLQYSHSSGVTDIKWVSPFREMSTSGQNKEIPESEDRRSMQFATASRDGSVLVWDLLAKPLTHLGSSRPERQLRRLRKRPSGLTVDISPFRFLNRVFIPIFKINLVEPHTNRPLPILTLSIRSTTLKYEEVNPDPNRIFRITDRIIYRPIFSRPTHPLLSGVIAGTTEGDFAQAIWEGFEFNAGEVVNKENARMISFAKYHDGPVVSLSRTELFPDLCLTVGGKVFALWSLKLSGKPVMWRRCKHRYTHGVWNSYRPSIFRLCRSDGSVEIWNLKTRSDRYQDIELVSGGTLTASYTHAIAMKQNVVGVGDAKGALRLFYVSHQLSQTTEEEKWSTYKICEREVVRKKNFQKWQETWALKNADYIKARNDQQLLIQQEKEEQIKREKIQFEEEKEQLAKEQAHRLASLQKPEPGKYAEWAQRHWMLRETERMNKGLLYKKALNMDVLEKQQLPLKKAIQEEHKKKMKQQQRVNNSQKIFAESVAMLFPDAIAKKPDPKPDPYGGGEPLETKRNHFQNFTNVIAKCEEFVKQNQYRPTFNWVDVMKAGRERRKILDGYYNRYNHTQRIIREKGGLPDVASTITLS